MSLINEALKRAKQAHQDNAPSQATVPVLRPVESPQPASRPGPGLILPIGLGVVALLGLMICFLLWKKQSATDTPSTQPLTVAAKTLSPEGNVVSKSPAPVSGHDADPSPSLPSANRPDAIGQGAERIAASAPTVPPNGSSQSATPSTNSDSSHLSTEPAAAPVPAPAPLRLQSIVFNPKRPSAMVNGHVVFVGDRIRDLRVNAIHSGDVVLVGTGVTNVLTLEQ